jgi:hypothetical protein
MTYNVRIVESTFFIPVKNRKKAYERMCLLNHTVTNSKKRGRNGLARFNAPKFGPHPDAWFTFLPWNFHEVLQSDEEILNNLGFDTTIEKNGNLKIVHYDSEMGQESLFLSAISNLSKGYLIWIGQDGVVLGETYGGKEVIRKAQTDYRHLVNVTAS